MSMYDDNKIYILKCHIVSGMCEVIEECDNQEEATELAEQLALVDKDENGFYFTFNDNNLF